MGTLYIVSTPIGNLQDITLRAISVLQSVPAIACEDTRRTGILLKFISEKFPENQRQEKPLLISYYEQNEYKRIPEIITFLKNGQDLVLVSDAGTPTISDPGFKLVRECVREGIRVESIPGPSSLISALVVSGLPTDKFLFIGYLPRKQGNRKNLLTKLGSALEIIKSTVIIFEAPHRLIQTLEELQATFGDIDIVVCRELTKVHEEVRREKISNSLEHFKKVAPKGEFVILFNLAVREYKGIS
ncbi:MAG: 16S rRNA (cytidine(1402)-2'-O)-methyltransferase [Candidatus Levybacteria bacterium]|nr:16S rRNA (cytidine(1402)-2'-O)-methyltransferase [Candidatus Levybacteria bacterium]